MVLPSLSCANSCTRCTVSSDVSSHGMTSTSGSTVAGLKKCMPTTRSGPGVTAASFMIGMEEVLLVSSTSGRTTLPRAANIAVLASSSSTAASLGQVVQGVGEPHPVDDGIALAEGEFAVADGLVQRSGEACLGALDRGLVHLTQDDIEAAARGDLRNAGSHDAATDDSYGLDHSFSCLSSDSCGAPAGESDGGRCERAPHRRARRRHV